MAARKKQNLEALDAFLPGPEQIRTAKIGIKKTMSRALLEAWDGNPRGDRRPDQLIEMGEDLELRGQLSQLITRPHPDSVKAAQGIEQVVAGVTRFLAGAAPYGDFDTYDVDSRALTDEEALDVAYAENAKRNDMAALDHSNYFARRLNMLGTTADDDASLRKVATIAGVSYERVRQYVNLLKLPGLTPLGIEPHSVLSEFSRLGLNEKHGRALLQLGAFPDLQLNLLRQIERSINPGKPNARMSGNQAMLRAEKLLTDETGEAKPKRGKKGETNSSKNPDDDDFKENDARLASTDHLTRAQNAGTAGVGSSAPASQGVGMATSDAQGQNTQGGPRRESLTDRITDTTRTLTAVNTALEHMSVPITRGGEAYALDFLIAEEKTLKKHIARLKAEIKEAEAKK